jgi:hypothetical protein
MKESFAPASTLELLEKTAKSYPPSSPEFQAIELAAKAILFIHANRQGRQFAEYIRGVNDPLTPEQKDFLRSIGLEP